MSPNSNNAWVKAPFTPLVALWLLCLCLAIPAAGEVVTLNLVSGDTLTGTVSGIRDGEVSLATDYGVVRVPAEKLSGESKRLLGISPAASGGEVESLRTRVRELEALVARLREENAAMRRGAAPAGANNQAAPAAPQAAPAPAAAGSATGFRLSSTGKRHNARCRYFSSNGRACGPSEGVACKVCGG
jgi:hypothetical protein